MKNKWQTKKLSAICEVFADGDWIEKKDQSPAGIRLVQTGNIGAGYFKDRGEKARYISEETFLRLNCTEVLPGDCLISRLPDPVGRACIVPDTGEKMITAVDCTILRFKKEVISEWFIYYSLSQAYQDQINRDVGGATRQRISRKSLGQISIPVPPIEEQKKILKKLDVFSADTERLKVIYSKKLDALDELKKSILKDTFTEDRKAVEATKIVPTSVDHVATPSPYIRNQIHAAIVDQVSRDGGWTTEVAVAKYDHLLQEVFGLPLGYEFETHQFGPFDSKIKRLLASGLNGNQWFSKKNGMIVFGTNVRGLLFRQSNLYKRSQAMMREMSHLGITKLDADRIELLSTVCHSIKETKSTALEEVRKFMSSWNTDRNRTKAEKFSEEQTKNCLDFVTKNGLYKRLLPSI